MQIKSVDNTNFQMALKLNPEKMPKRLEEKPIEYILSLNEFGNKIKYDFNNSIIQNYDIVIADEIHNLINYQEMDDSSALYSVQINIFKKYNNTKIFMFTATPYYLDRLKERFNNIDENFKNWEVKNNEKEVS